MALPLLPILLLGLGGAAVAASTRKRRRLTPMMGSFLGCEGLIDLHRRAAKDPGENNIDAQIVRMVQEDGAAFLGDKSFKLIDPPFEFGFSNERPYTEYNRWAYSIASKIYNKIKCNERPPLPGQGTFEDRLLFWAIYREASELYSEKALGSMDVPELLTIDGYVVDGMPFVTNEAADQLILKLSTPLPQVIQDNDSSEFDAFDARATTQLERSLLTAWGKIAGYNAGFSQSVPEQFIQRELGSLTQSLDAASGAVHMMFWSRTGKVAPPRAVNLLSPLAMILVYRRGWASPIDPINVTPQITHISPDVKHEPPIYFVRTNDRQAQTAIMDIVNALAERGAYGDDLEAIAAASLMLSTDPKSGMPGAADVLVNGLIETGYSTSDEWSYVPELADIINSSPMTPERQQAISILELSQPVLWRLWSEVTDMIIEREGEIPFNFG